MRTLTPALANHLASGATSLCHCWKLTRKDGSQQGFTDHDRALVFDGLTFEAASGFTASNLESGLGLSPDNMEAEGALASDSIAEQDIALGKYDEASIELWRVNWREPEQRILLTKGTLGEIRRNGNQWLAEMRSQASKLESPVGRVFQHHCDADLGDARCKVDLSSASFSGDGAVVTVQGRALHVSGVDAYEAGLFAHGRCRFTTGALAGQAFDIRHHFLRGTQVWIELWDAPNTPPASGDQVHLVAGCDKHFSTCCKRFANGANFRGFPHMPGNDFIIAPARELS